MRVSILVLVLILSLVVFLRLRPFPHLHPCQPYPILVVTPANLALRLSLPLPKTHLLVLIELLCLTQASQRDVLVARTHNPPRVLSPVIAPADAPFQPRPIPHCHARSRLQILVVRSNSKSF